MIFIGIDLGTSAVKLIAMKENGKILKTVSKEYPSKTLPLIPITFAVCAPDKAKNPTINAASSPIITSIPIIRFICLPPLDMYMLSPGRKTPCRIFKNFYLFRKISCNRNKYRVK